MGLLYFRKNFAITPTTACHRIGGPGLGLLVAARLPDELPWCQRLFGWRPRREKRAVLTLGEGLKRRSIWQRLRGISECCACSRRLVFLKFKRIKAGNTMYARDGNEASCSDRMGFT